VEISVAVLLAARGERDRSGWAAVDAIRIHDQEDWPENAPASLEIVRMLHESIDHAAGLTDEEIRKRWGTVLLTGGLEDAAGYRRVATELRRLGHHVSPKELAAEDLRRTKAWRRFKNPRTRPPGAAYFLCSYRLIWSLVDSWEGVQFFVSRDRASHVINLRVVLEELERATGDHWRGWSEIKGADDDR
jgi:hypothetical protein